ncbi:hypothetical protein CPAST_c30570 [Clostridium pasteurianum DSM 525 = ATCC 6013]|uniref:Uncharacterized protein n=1 Tax=Clostridium pasteurianum DSM 525 = ATCC 6013 TaxID=1262449 RepID=A0A0H3JA03_CLOPA|nr:hypothetical protein [Clostridium pasteurianum]AJA49123.1 hypothetical protein CPAST_c30570 [Clostridium pasteurianum DSM 525 = ATCC 6013]AJA53111.1 hypothetical protein CLPA_c30570 [Clostridium pasteurianum DSM 525 = ATCC 6013]AOZ76317.1 hypothetical protein AQ983_14855 [Clostridium pasteurianum DSM 525 = ATCC 6013]AOZ80114.1 hypothetical protein AQ984_14850 [Clostridium pasteurianum]ELP59057.1 hypothetical protein F502_11236 [Clostridium pasteurianum DSM 525 = ATCC 6013]
MDLSFLDVQHIRMKKIGAYALLFRNSIAKGTWKKYGFEEGYEQDNLIFSVLLYIMEQSLKEEICTIDHIAAFIDELNNLHFKKGIIYEECRGLGEFIVNTILCDEGNAMYFKAYNFKEGQYKDININFIKNKMEYIEGVRRVSYSLTDDGYSLLLSTLEIEENLKITIHEIVFKMHLEKASYDKAADDIKNIFNMLRIRVQSMEDAIRKIKENPLAYSTKDYKSMMEGNIDILNNTKKQFIIHREMVNEKINEFIEHDIHIKELNKEEEENLNNLRIIEKYLSRTIDEDQRVLKKHFDLKDVYGKELENISKMSLIERFNFRKEVYDRILDNPNKLEDIDIFLRPLFKMHLEKYYNINKALEYQKVIRKAEIEENEEISFDEEGLIEAENKKKLERLEKYKGVIEIFLELAIGRDKISLGEINSLIKESETLMITLIPTVEIFREVIIEMLKNRTIDIAEIREERKNFVESGEIEFQLNKSILEIIDANNSFKKITKIKVEKILDHEDIKLEGLRNENGDIKNFICSDISIEIIKSGGLRL